MRSAHGHEGVGFAERFVCGGLRAAILQAVREGVHLVAPAVQHGGVLAAQRNEVRVQREQALEGVRRLLQRPQPRIAQRRVHLHLVLLHATTSLSK